MKGDSLSGSISISCMIFKFSLSFLNLSRGCSCESKVWQDCVRQALFLHPHPAPSIQCNLILHQPCHSSSELFLRQHSDIIYMNMSILGSQLSTFFILRLQQIRIKTKHFRVNFKQTTVFRVFKDRLTLSHLV